MKISKTITTLALSSLLLTSATFAQEANQPGQPPQGRPGMRQEFRQERREDIKEIRGEVIESKKEFREGVKDLRAWKQASTTATGTRPTPFKDLRQDMRDARKDFMQDRREDMGRGPKPLNATATAAIAAKLGITAEALQAQLASGTKLKELVKDKITPEEMKNIMPPRVATFTRAIQENGFFGNIRSKIFGAKKEIVEEKMNEFGEVEENVRPDDTPRPFWQKFFGF